MLLSVVVVASGLEVNTFTCLSVAFQGAFALVGAMDLVAVQSSSVMVSFVAMGVMARLHAMDEDDVYGEAYGVFVTRNIVAHFPIPVLAWIHVIRFRPRLDYGLSAFNACAALLVLWRAYGNYRRIYGEYTHMSEAATFLIYMATVLALAVVTRWFARGRD